MRKTNQEFRMIESKNYREEIKLNKKTRRMTDEYINQYF